MSIFNQIISKSLGTLMVQSGDGVPAHVAPIGSLYTDATSYILYSYKQSFGWVPLNTISYGEYHYQDWAATTTIPKTPDWTRFPSVFSASTMQNGMELFGITNKYTNTTYKSDRITILRSGNYEVKAIATIFSTTADDNVIRVGVAKNSAVTSIQAASWIYQAVANNQKRYCQIGLSGVLKNVLSGDTIGLVIASDTASVSVACKHASIFLKRII